MNRSDNFFDNLNPVETDIEEIKKQRAEAEAKGKHLDYLIHQVFFQNEQGAELLEIWKESLIMTPIPKEERDEREGMNRFIRGILLTIKRVNEGEK